MGIDSEARSHPTTNGRNVVAAGAGDTRNRKKKKKSVEISLVLLLLLSSSPRSWKEARSEITVNEGHRPGATDSNRRRRDLLGCLRGRAPQDDDERGRSVGVASWEWERKRKKMQMNMRCSRSMWRKDEESRRDVTIGSGPCRDVVQLAWLP